MRSPTSTDHLTNSLDFKPKSQDFRLKSTSVDVVTFLLVSFLSFCVFVPVPTQVCRAQDAITSGFTNRVV